MGILDPIYANPLSVRVIPNVDPNFAEQLKLRPDQHSIGLITADNDDATYVSIDEATKMADVEVVYAHSFYAGAAHASRPGCQQRGVCHDTGSAHAAGTLIGIG